MPKQSSERVLVAPIALRKLAESHSVREVAEMLGTAYSSTGKLLTAEQVWKPYELAAQSFLKHAPASERTLFVRVANERAQDIKQVLAALGAKVIEVQGS